MSNRSVRQAGWQQCDSEFPLRSVTEWPSLHRHSVQAKANGALLSSPHHHHANHQSHKRIKPPNSANHYSGFPFDDKNMVRFINEGFVLKLWYLHVSLAWLPNLLNHLPLSTALLHYTCSWPCLVKMIIYLGRYSVPLYEDSVLLLYFAFGAFIS